MIEEYDNNGKHIKDTYYESSKISNWKEFEYDSEGKMTKSISYDANGEITGWTTYRVDKGHLILDHSYDKDGNMLQ